MKRLLLSVLSVSVLSLVATAAPSKADLELARRQARSVHLQYATGVKNAASVQGTVTVTETQKNSYYCLFGWDCGYCGIQDKGEHGRVVIFSVWDPVDPFDWAAKPDDVKEEERARVLYSAPEVDVARFGGEGTGARTMFPYAWKVGEGVTIKIDAEADGKDRTAFTCSLKREDGSWLKLATVSTLKVEGKGEGINDVYSFVEDFWRNYYSATLTRRAEYSDIVVKATPDADWRKVERAFFSADKTPSHSIDAGRTDSGAFFLQTGGLTKNTHAKLWSVIN